MTDSAENQPEQDPRQEKFVVDTELLTEDQLQGLVEEYCTRYHGLNDTENPMGEQSRVMSAEVLVDAASCRHDGYGGVSAHKLHPGCASSTQRVSAQPA